MNLALNQTCEIIPSVSIPCQAVFFEIFENSPLTGRIGRGTACRAPTYF